MPHLQSLLCDYTLGVYMLALRRAVRAFGSSQQSPYTSLRLMVTGTYGDLWGPMENYGRLWGPMRVYGDLYGPMGVNVDP